MDTYNLLQVSFVDLIATILYEWLVLSNRVKYSHKTKRSLLDETSQTRVSIITVNRVIYSYAHSQIFVQCRSVSREKK